MRIELSLLVVFVCLPSAFSEEKKIPKELVPLQGTWVPTKKVAIGVEVPAEDLDKECGTYAIQGNKVALYRGGKQIATATITIDSSKSPAQFFLKPDDEGKEIGIYKVDKDTLTLCISTDSKAYPTKFESTKDSNTELIVFKKSK